MIRIVGQINEEAFKSFCKQLDASEGRVYIELHSEGGSYYDGLAFADKIMTYSGKVWVHVTGMCHSAAVAILAAADYRSCGEFSSLMVHESEEKLKGRASEIMAKAERLMDEENLWNRLMERGTGTPAAEWAKLSKSETYLSPQYALQLGLIDEIKKGKLK